MWRYHFSCCWNSGTPRTWPRQCRIPDGKCLPVKMLRRREKYVCGSFATFGKFYDVTQRWRASTLTNLAECCFSTGLCCMVRATCARVRKLVFLGFSPIISFLFSSMTIDLCPLQIEMAIILPSLPARWYCKNMKWTFPRPWACLLSIWCHWSLMLYCLSPPYLSTHLPIWNPEFMRPQEFASVAPSVLQWDSSRLQSVKLLTQTDRQHLFAGRKCSEGDST